MLLHIFLIACFFILNTVALFLEFSNGSLYSFISAFSSGKSSLLFLVIYILITLLWIFLILNVIYMKNRYTKNHFKINKILSALSVFACFIFSLYFFLVFSSYFARLLIILAFVSNLILYFLYEISLLFENTFEKKVEDKPNVFETKKSDDIDRIIKKKNINTYIINQFIHLFIILMFTLILGLLFGLFHLFFSFPIVISLCIILFSLLFVYFDFIEKKNT
ncbi:MAG TPA: hypothetical protein PLX16_00560 [Exilispira sp.]|nr:hypothetical protein [Exilispira sp.]